MDYETYLKETDRASVLANFNEEICDEVRKSVLETLKKAATTAFMPLYTNTDDIINLTINTFRGIIAHKIKELKK